MSERLRYRLVDSFRVSLGGLSVSADVNGVELNNKPLNLFEAEWLLRWLSEATALAKSRTRFWSKVDKGDEKACWVWQGALSSNGYGQFSVAGRPVSAHTAAYQLTHGSVPEGWQLDHLCRNRGCVNPGHLEAVTPRENQIRSPISLAGINSKKTHCPHGHEYDVVKRDRSRRCKTCERERARYARANV